MDSLKQKLNNKVQKEYDNFIEILKKSTSEKVIERAYEKVTKEETMSLIQNKELDNKQIKALLKSSNLLEECYDEWLKSDCNFNEMIDYSLEHRIDIITDEYTADNKKKSTEKDSR